MHRHSRPREIAPVGTATATALKLYVGDELSAAAKVPPKLSPHMSLSEFYWAFLRPVLVAAGAAKRNLKQYEQSLGYWVRFTGDPPLITIDDLVIAAFLRAVSQLPGRKTETLSANTIIKHCVHLQAVIDRSGPRTREVRNGQGLLKNVPYFTRPRLLKKLAEDSFTLNEMTAILRNCAAARAPAEYLEQREIYWQNLFLADYNLGLRIGSLMILEWSMWRGDWLYVPVKFGHTKKVFVNQHARECFERMRPVTGQAQRIWPWRNWPTSEAWLHANRRFILEAADIPEERRFGFHGFRKLMCTEAAEINPLGASLQAGHEDMKTTINRYIHPKIVANTMRRLPQPRRDDPRQRQLF